MSAAVDILDHLTSQPASFLFHTDGPPLRSSTARQLESDFKWKTHLSPMVFHTEAGVVLYDRVVTGSQEGRLLDELSKPKQDVKPIHNKRAGRTVKSGGSGAPAMVTSQQHNSPAGHNCSASPTGQACRNATQEEAGSKPIAVQTPLSYTRHIPQPRPGSREAAAIRFFQQQRATITANQVFTWGGRLTQRTLQRAGGGYSQKKLQRGASNSMLTGATHKAPLRLDSYKDDVD